jgi:hypothetical protein
MTASSLGLFCIWRVVVVQPLYAAAVWFLHMIASFAHSRNYRTLFASLVAAGYFPGLIFIHNYGKYTLHRLSLYDTMDMES